MLDPSHHRFFESICLNESWEEYAHRRQVPNDPALRHFHRHVLFDHYSDFVRRFPWFAFEQFTFAFEEWETERVYRSVQYDDGEVLDDWYFHIDADRQFPLLNEMRETLTWPQPIVLFDFQNGFEKRHPHLVPVHLIEGTHRVSYLRRFYEKRIVEATSRHVVLVLRNIEPDYPSVSDSSAK